jgi:hypothetical protein
MYIIVGVLICTSTLPPNAFKQGVQRTCMKHGGILKESRAKKCYNFILQFGEKYNYKTKAPNPSHTIFQRYNF